MAAVGNKRSLHNIRTLLSPWTGRGEEMALQLVGPGSIVMCGPFTHRLHAYRARGRHDPTTWTAVGASRTAVQLYSFRAAHEPCVCICADSCTHNFSAVDLCSGGERKNSLAIEALLVWFITLA